MEQHDQLLLVFGDLDTSGRRLFAPEILRTLLGACVWLTPRLPKALRLPTSAVFYMTGVGVVASARVVGVRPTKSLSVTPLPGLPLSMFPFTLDLADVKILEKPHDVRPLIDRLSFVSNKTYWGHGFRYSPRLISRPDFRLLTTPRTSAGARESPKP